MTGDPAEPLIGSKTVAVAVVLGTLGAAVLVMLPGLVAAVGKAYHLENSQLGYFSSADLAGVTIGCAIGALLSVRLGVKGASALGAAVAIGGNAASLLANDFAQLLATRTTAGIGAGLLVANAYIIFGLSRNVNRSFSIFVTAQCALGAVMLKLMPFLAGAVGVQGIFVILAAAFALALPLVLILPGKDAFAARVPGASGQRAAWIGIAGLLLFFAAEGIIWTYLDSIGTLSGVSPSDIASGVALASIAALGGPLLAATIGSKFGDLAPMFFAGIISIAALVMFSVPLDSFAFALNACLFNFAWNFVIPYQMNVIAKVDVDGVAAGWAASASFGGLAVGPSLAGLVLETQGLISIMVLSGVLLALSTVVLFGVSKFKSASV